MRVLVTGACGFIGSHMAEAWLDAGAEVFGIDNLETGREDNFPADGELLIGDIRDHPSFAVFAARARPDVIYHAAATYRDRLKWHTDATTNVVGSINVAIEALKHDARVVYFQTSLCYGVNPPSPVTKYHPLNPEGSYAVSKTAGEAYLRDSGVPFVSLRLANVYGPRNLSGPAPAFYRRLKAGEPCTVVDSRRDFIFIDDLVDAAFLAADAADGVYHISTGDDYAVRDVYRGVAAAMGVDVPEPELTPRQSDDAATILIEPSRWIGDAEWVAETALADGLAEAVAWYDAHGVTETFTHLAVR